MNIHRTGAVAPWIVIVGAALLATGCRSKVEEERREVNEAREESQEARQEAREDLDAARARAQREIGEAESDVAEEERELRIAEGYDVLSERTQLDDRMDRLDERMLELQASINQLGTQGADTSDHQTTWESFDQRRAALKRSSTELGVHSGADLDARKRMITQDIERLEADLESAIDDVRSHLSRG